MILIKITKVDVMVLLQYNKILRNGINTVIKLKNRKQ